MFKELKNGIEILVGQAVLSYGLCSFWINNSRTAWPTLILMQFFEFLRQFTITGLSNLWPTGHMRPSKQYCVAHKVTYILIVLAELMK